MPMYKIIASGWVQGVGYRSHACQCAKALNLRGTVRNCSEGTVEIYVHGSKSGVDEFVGFLQEYPDPKRLTHIDKQEIKSDINYINFESISDEDE
jgi:acylphosphatase